MPPGIGRKSTADRGPALISIHNLRFFQRWMGEIRAAIREGRLDQLVAPVETLVLTDDGG
ncbi:MAG TPA: hypothetical protein VM008_16305 [Phycisphaerae bacterium]|nr:hypothetical protein [Phycisphaerae bacterium]